jgi:hypothetical protein
MEKNLRLLHLLVLSQALEDLLRFELGLPLEGQLRAGEAEDFYEEALVLVSHYPPLRQRVVKLKKAGKRRWLKELENARTPN